MIGVLSPRRALLLAFVGFALLSSACSVFGGGDSGSADGAGVSRVLLTSDLDASGQPVNPRNVFNPNISELRATVTMTGAKAGMKVTGTWYQLGTSSAGATGQEVSTSDVSLDAASLQNNGTTLTFALRPGSSGLPEDSWLLRVSVNGQLVKTSGFVVTRSAAASGGTAAPSNPALVTYTVLAGDTMQTVAQKYLPAGEALANFVNRVAQLNNLAANATLTAGQVIRIPGPQ